MKQQARSLSQKSFIKKTESCQHCLHTPRFVNHNWSCLNTKMWKAGTSQELVLEHSIEAICEK